MSLTLESKLQNALLCINARSGMEGSGMSGLAVLERLQEMLRAGGENSVNLKGLSRWKVR
jgi:hypothetical protein